MLRDGTGTEMANPSSGSSLFRGVRLDYLLLSLIYCWVSGAISKRVLKEELMFTFVCGTETSCHHLNFSHMVSCLCLGIYGNKMKMKNVEQGIQASIWIYSDISAGVVMFKICSTTQEEIQHTRMKTISAMKACAAQLTSTTCRVSIPAVDQR